MKRVLKWIGVAALSTFVVIQFVPVDRSNPPIEADLIAPVSWVVAHDVEETRAEMPLQVYRVTHAGARLTPEQLETLRRWTYEE